MRRNRVGDSFRDSFQPKPPNRGQLPGQPTKPLKTLRGQRATETGTASGTDQKPGGKEASRLRPEGAGGISSLTPLSTPTQHDGRWWENAACKGTPIDWWFPTETPEPRTGQTQRRTSLNRIKHICAACPVAAQCHQDAQTSTTPTWGIWAGINYSHRVRRGQPI